MRRAPFLLAVLAVLATGATLAAQDPFDVVHLETGESVPCRVEALTDNIVTFSLLTSGGPAGGSAKRTLPADRVSRVDFGWADGEAEAFARRGELDAESLEGWWDLHFAHLHRPRSRTAAWGIALAAALLRDEGESGASRALSLCDRIVARAWSSDDIAAARKGRLEALIAKGELDTAVTEARLLAGETEDPALLISVKFLLAEADFERLRILEEDNPRWEQDDEVRPERNLLYHGIVDQYLWPHLFHATRAEAASRGLLRAGEVYRFGNDPGRAAASYRDLVRLYPGTTAAMAAKERLEELTEDPPTTERDNP